VAAAAVIGRVQRVGWYSGARQTQPAVCHQCLAVSAVVDEFGRRGRLLDVIRRVTLPTQHLVKLIGYDRDFSLRHSEDGREDLGGVGHPVLRVEQYHVLRWPPHTSPLRFRPTPPQQLYTVVSASFLPEAYGR